jgi:MFS family permease
MLDRTRLPSRIVRALPLAGAFLVGAIAYGGLYTFPALSVAFAAEFGTSRTLAVTPWTVFLVLSGLASPLLGRAFDLFYDRQLLVAGMCLVIAGWVAVAVAPDIGIVILAYGVLLALGLQLVFVGTSTAIARRYAGISGLALGIAYAGPGIGVAVAMLLVEPSLAAIGWRWTTAGFALTALAGLPFVWLMTSGPSILVPVHQPRPGTPAAPTPRARLAMAVEDSSAAQLPARHRLERTQLVILEETAAGLHEASAPGAIAAAQEALPPGGPGRPTNVLRTLRTHRFWILFGGAIAIGVFDEGTFQSFLPHVTGRGVAPALAAAALGGQALAYVVGQVVGGGLSDRYGRQVVGQGAIVVLVTGVTMAFLASGEAPGLAVAGILLHGLGLGATIAVRSAAFSDVFGGHDFGTIFGILAIAYPIGGSAAVVVGGVGADRIGSYWPVYGMILVSLVGWAAALWLALPRRRGRARRGSAAN